jgi:PRTRC genetic system protein C
MTNTSQEQYQKRVFQCEGHTFADPGAAFSSEQVRQHLLQYFPSLAYATTEENVKDGVLTVTFRKQVTHKG